VNFHKVPELSPQTQCSKKFAEAVAIRRLRV